MTYKEQATKLIQKNRSLQDIHDSATFSVRTEVIEFLRSVGDDLDNRAQGDRAEDIKMMASRARSIAGQLESGRRGFSSTLRELIEEIHSLGIRC